MVEFMLQHGGNGALPNNAGEIVLNWAASKGIVTNLNHLCDVDGSAHSIWIVVDVLFEYN